METFKEFSSLNNDELNQLIKPMIMKIETLGATLHLDMNKEDSVIRVLRNARDIYALWVKADDDLGDKILKESCMEVLQKVAGEDINDIRNAISLTKEIIDEFKMRVKEYKK